MLYTFMAGKFESEDRAKLGTELALDDETSEVKGHARKKRGKRKPLPQNLPRRRVIHDLPADRKVCPIHNQALVKIGERTSEKLEVIPARVEIIEEVTLAYKCPCCSSEAEQNPIVTSQPEPALLPKSFATPSLLAYIVTAKYQDALPLYRQEKIFQRYGIDLDRTTMARWMIQVGQAAQALINLMYDDLLERRVIGCDETPVQVLKENNRQASQKSYMWPAFYNTISS
ncbi:MAG: transposase [Oligoflexus sp.]